VAAIDAAVAALDRRRPALAERLHVKKRLRVWRHRRRFSRARAES
jgi:hypothetical protein